MSTRTWVQSDWRVFESNGGAFICDAADAEKARLIAAAPEMLEALKASTDALIEMLPRIHGARMDEVACRAFVSGLIAKAQAAIVKAEGQS